MQFSRTIHKIETFPPQCKGGQKIRRNDMTGRMKFSGMVIIAVFITLCISMGGAAVFASDELLVTGTLKSIDQRYKTVTVDVRSSACRGLDRKFRFDPKDLEKVQGKEGQDIRFHIDSPVCKRDTVYNMILPGGPKK